MKKNIKLTNKKERMILSDTLPYETPPTFSNYGFYKIISPLDITISKNKITWTYIDPARDLLIRLLFNIQIPHGNIIGERKEATVSNFSSIPFDYRIKKDNDSFRALSLIHPKNQIKSCSFYDKYKNLIIYLCNIDSFSIRRPSKIAKSVYYKEKSRCNLSSEDEVIEAEMTSENFKSFFVYKDYSNIHKFFESDEYHRCEKVYNSMAKVDINQCFGSIYTHSIAWATFGKTSTKNVLSSFIDGSLNNSFPDEFDRLIQDSNYKETNGIPVGSELSRVFAEIIMQKIDNNIIRILNSEGISHKKDYEIFRYVDDYFVFYNSPVQYKNILNCIELELSHYKLSLNKSKEIIYAKP